MKKTKVRSIIILIILITIIVCLGVWATYIIKNKFSNKKQNVKTEEIAKQQEITIKNTTVVQQGNVEITDVNILNDGNLTNVSATVKNLNKKSYKSISVNIIFYDANKVQISVAKGLVENINTNEQKTFSSYITGDYTKGATYEVKVDKVQE